MANESSNKQSIIPKMAGLYTSFCQLHSHYISGNHLPTLSKFWAELSRLQDIHGTKELGLAPTLAILPIMLNLLALVLHL
jgi:hypothetical protein